MLRDHILVPEHTWAAEEGSHCDCDYPSPESLHSDVAARAEAEALEAAADLDSAVGAHVTRHSLEVDSYDAPWADARRLEQTSAGTQLVALGLLESVAGGKNQPSKTCSRAPGWHGPNGCVGCTGDTLALPGRHAGA